MSDKENLEFHTYVVLEPSKNKATLSAAIKMITADEKGKISDEQTERSFQKTLLRKNQEKPHK